MADGNWNREMQEQFEALRKAIAADIAERFEAGEGRLREGLSAEIDARFNANEERLGARFSASEQRLREALSADLDSKFAASEQRLTTVITEQLETAQRHLDGRLNVHAEELSERFSKFAEGYGGTLEGIQRELKEFRSEWRDKVDDTDRVLAKSRRPPRRH